MYAKILAMFNRILADCNRWSEKLPKAKSPLETTWLHHEIGRCHLELGNYSKALSFGEESLEAAHRADDDVWVLNATVLVAQAEG